VAREKTNHLFLVAKRVHMYVGADPITNIEVLISKAEFLHIVVHWQHPLQDLGMHQRAIEECRGHGYDSPESGSEQVGPPTRERYRDIVAYLKLLGRTHQDGVDKPTTLCESTPVSQLSIFSLYMRFPTTESIPFTYSLKSLPRDNGHCSSS
jgi:hypothetical protein